MSSKPRGANSDYEYLRAASDQKEHTENEHGVLVTATVRLLSRPSVCSVSLEAWTKGEERAQAPLCSYTSSWPNATVVSWPAFLFQCYVKLDRLVEDSSRDYAKEWTFRQK
jgi:hypothetical protein